MVEQRMLLIGGSFLTKRSIKGIGLIMVEVCNDLEPLLKKINFVENAPFKTISIIIRFGTKFDLTLDYEGINKRYKELNVAVMLETESLIMADKVAVKETILKTTCHILFDIAQKYNLPSEKRLYKELNF